MLHICPRLPGQRFKDPPLEEEILSFNRDLGHTREIKVLIDVNVNYMHQPWRSIAAIINKCLSGKTTSLDSLCLSRAQILWGMYHKKNVGYVYLLWEDLVYQVENKNSKKNNAYKEYYAIASGAEPPKAKTKYKKKADDFVTSPKSKTASDSKGTRLKSKANVMKPDMKKQPAKKTKAKGLAVLSEVALSISEQINEDEDDNDDDGDIDDDAESDDHDDNSDDERTESDSDEIHDPNLINDEDPSAGLDRGTKRRKSGKDAESSKDSRSKEKKYSSTSKDASHSQQKSFGKSIHVEEPSHAVKESGMQQDQEFATGDNDEQPVNKESPVVVNYDKHTYFGTSHWGTKRQRFYGYASNLTSSKDVYSKRRIIAVNRLTIMKKYDYSHMEEIEVCRDDQQLYKFKEGDFKRLRLQDIQDMLLLLTYCHSNAGGRSSIRCRKLLKKLNLTKPDTYRSNLRNKTAYTSHSDPHGIIYVDQFKRKRLMRTDKLYKFSDGTLNDVRTALHDIAAGIRRDYLPIRKLSNLEKKRAWVMVQDIDKQLY
nr:hypothetical protein [Tanacetum cinerariifolium]